MTSPVNHADLALSIKQPWPELILLGRKTIELRSWDTDYRGPLWLHAGKSANPTLDDRFGIADPPRGAFVGRVQLTSIAPVDPDRWARWRPSHLDPGAYQPGMFAWTFSSPERLRTPVPAPGRLKLFPVDAETAARLRAAIGP